MSLPPDQMQVVVERLTAKMAGGGFCPSCHKRHLVLAPDLYMVVKYNIERRSVSPDGQPCVSLICKFCGHSMFFNVFLAGLSDIFGISPEVSDVAIVEKP